MQKAVDCEIVVVLNLLLEIAQLAITSSSSSSSLDLELCCDICLLVYSIKEDTIVGLCQH